MQLQELFDYKNRLMRDLLSNETIVKLIDESITDVNTAYEKLAYKRIFPFDYIPETIEEAGTYVCFDVDIQKSLNKTYLLPTIYIWLFSHKSVMRLPEGGVRTDALAFEISKAINGSRYYGLGELDLYSVKRYAPISDYQGKLMMFTANEFNRQSPSKHDIPANRKKW